MCSARKVLKTWVAAFHPCSVNLKKEISLVWHAVIYQTLNSLQLYLVKSWFSSLLQLIINKGRQII